MTEDYLAHSAKNGYAGQSYKDHIENTEKLALGFAEELKQYCSRDASQIENILRTTVRHHDLGKLHKENQAVLHKKDEKRTFSNKPCRCRSGISETEKTGCTVFAYACVFTHLGLPDSLEEDRRGEVACYRDEYETTRAYVDCELEQMLRVHRSVLPPSTTHHPERCEGNPSVLMRMMLSCLADADYSDTAAVYGHSLELEKVPTLQPKLRLEALNRYVAGLPCEQSSERNDLRTQMYEECRECEIEVGIVSNAGPVGSGKTTAVMAHQLRQATLRGSRRIFVILPYTNIITQSVKVYRKALVLPGEDPEAVVAELHHRADFENKDMCYLTSLWKAPIIVTTAVAFFETLSSNRPSTLRRLHELPGSIIFLDEAHAALPLKLLPLAWRWMKIFEEEWSCYWILASGSPVRFWQLEDLVGSEEKQVPEMVNETLQSALQGYEKRRINFCWEPRPQSRTELIDWVMSKTGPRLVIMNTVQSAAVIANDICKKYGKECVEHLSTALMPMDRAKTIEVIKKRLEDQPDTNWVLVATSCVEAGVDFSFRIGFREQASVLSLLQSAGRINRNGLCDYAEMWSFSMQDDLMLTRNPEIKVSAGLLEEYLRDNTEITPELSTRSISEELRRGRNTKKEIEDLLEAEAKLNFKTVNDKFNVIENDALPVIVDAAVADNIKQGRTNWREVQKYSVSIQRKALERWQAEQIAEGVYKWTRSYNSFLGYMDGALAD